jgi:hypothetical protein
MRPVVIRSSGLSGRSHSDCSQASLFAPEGRLVEKQDRLYTALNLGRVPEHVPLNAAEVLAAAGQRAAGGFTGHLQ